MKTIIIDEVLQTSPKVFDWVRSHIGKYNIIICTDSRQMLTPIGGATMLEEFEKLKEEDYTECIDLTETKRAVNEYSRRLYNFCFEHVNDDYPLYKVLAKNIKKIDNINSIEYNENNAYICHTNDIEEYLYNHWNLYNRYELELIPKGGIASKTVNISDKYPIIPQKQVNRRIRSYYQIANIGTVIRYQGTEVAQGNKLYFFVEDFSKVGNREFYTMLTRCKDCNDIIIVTVDVPRDDIITSYNGKPVKKKVTPVLDGATVLKDGTTVADNIKEGFISVDALGEALKNINDTEELHYIKDKAYIDGEYVRATFREENKKPKLTITGLLNKDNDIKCQYMGRFLKTFEAVQNNIDFDDGFNDGKFIDTIIPANLKEWTSPIDDVKNRFEYAYACDLFSAYSHVLVYGDIPAGYGFIPRNEMQTDRLYHTDINTPDGVDFYMYTSSELFPFGTLLTGNVVRYIQARASCPAVYIGTAPKLERCKMGETLIKKAHDSIESKAEVKEVHYGYLEKSFLEGLDYENGEATAYVINKENNNQLLMVAIRSELALICLKIREAVTGKIYRSPVCVDCVYFDTNEDIKTVGDRIHGIIPNFDFRIHNPKNKQEVYYQTYENLKTRKEKAKERKHRKKK